MKIRTWLFIVMEFAGSAFAQGNKTTNPVKFANDGAHALISDNLWAGGELPGQWTSVSTNSTTVSKESRTLGETFGFTPARAESYFSDGRLTKLVLIYLEAGEFFGFRKSKELEYHRVGLDSTQQQTLTKQIQQTKKLEDRDLKDKRKQFDARFNELDAALPENLEQILRTAGKHQTIGASQLRSRVLEFVKDQLTFRLDIEHEQLIAITIQLSDQAGKKLLATDMSSRNERRGDIRVNVDLPP